MPRREIKDDEGRVKEEEGREREERGESFEGEAYVSNAWQIQGNCNSAETRLSTGSIIH